LKKLVELLLVVVIITLIACSLTNEDARLETAPVEQPTAPAPEVRAPEPDDRGVQEQIIPTPQADTEIEDRDASTPSLDEESGTQQLTEPAQIQPTEESGVIL
jgi:hypothetical protein